MIQICVKDLTIRKVGIVVLDDVVVPEGWDSQNATMNSL